LVAEAAARQGFQVVAVGFPGETRPDLARRVAVMHWISLGQFGRLIRIFKQSEIKRAYMAGQIRHKRMFSQLKFDLKALSLLARLRDKRADSILKTVAEALDREGVHLVSPLPLLKEYLPQPGVLTRRRPSPQERKDIEFGYRLAKHVASADIGQTVVVKNQAVLAVEAMEGTDACIVRGGRYARQGAVVVKVAKPSQDMRFDTPVLGPRTIAAMRKVGARLLAFDARQTLLLKRPEVLAAAEAAGITLIAL